jgi:3',5'-cyclic AMP phosphodiesterase CpdA
VTGAASGDGVAIVHVSDVHFGRDCDLVQIEALERFVPSLGAHAIALSGDVSQRARHGELQAAHAFVHRLRAVAPTLVIPGNHDVQWWASPLGIRGAAPLYRKYRRYFGDDLTPVLELPGLVMASALTSYGVALGSVTPRLRDLAVKGHLPRRETDRVREIFAKAPAGAARVLVIHHNVLPGKISGRMGLAHWKDAQRRLGGLGADVVLCGHDHQEGAGQVGGRLAVSSAGTHTSRTRGGRPSVFNLVRVDPISVHIQHYRWESHGRRFLPSDRFTFVRGDPRHAAVSVAGGQQPR